MTISYQWLQEYLPEAIPLEKLENILTSIGLEVEGHDEITKIPGGLKGLVVGEVLTCIPHPNADKLRLTTVNIGTGDPLNIVCGAPNVAAGQKVIIATVGTTIYPSKGEPFTIKKAKIRGEESSGMICAEDEIGLGESHDGIMILPADTQVGLPAAEYFKLPENDFAIHIGLTPNRSDANSHIGVAREVMAWMAHHEGKKPKINVPNHKIETSVQASPITVSIDHQKGCTRYMGALLENVKVGPSPQWLQDRLQAIGQRSINNVVDVTNYVLHEFGNPLHAFDAQKISGNKIVVRTAQEGEQFIALDGKKYELSVDDMIIANANESMCIAGVMGGIDSGVTEQTTSVFLESAYFLPEGIRKTSLKHGIRSEAATHFEKGVSYLQVPQALNRAIDLLQSITGANLASDIVDVVTTTMTKKVVSVKYAFIKQLSGIDLPSTQIQSLLQALGFNIVNGDEESLLLEVPDFKHDIHGPADIVEEILRLHGLDNIPISANMQYSMDSVKIPNSRKLKNRIADYLVAQGFQEIMTNSITNAHNYDDQSSLVKMLNSLTVELNALRPEMLYSGLEVVQYNINRKNKNLFLFEFGNTYNTSGIGEYHQQEWLSMWLTGSDGLDDWRTKSKTLDTLYIKGLLQTIIQFTGLKNIQFSSEDQTMYLKQGQQILGKYTAVSEKDLNKFGIKQPVWYVEINWQLLVSMNSRNSVTYTEVPKYPAVERDLALILDKEIAYRDVEKITLQQKISSLTQFKLFDIFEDAKLGENKKSYAVNYTFQLKDRTLTDAEIDSAMNQLIKAYNEKLNAQIRN